MAFPASNGRPVGKRIMRRLTLVETPPFPYRLEANGS
jgi:hypothetical protein